MTPVLCLVRCPSSGHIWSGSIQSGPIEHRHQFLGSSGKSHELDLSEAVTSSRKVQSYYAIWVIFILFLCIDVLKIFLPYEKMRKLIFILFYGNSISHHHRLSKQVRTVRLLDPLLAPPRRSSIPCRRGKSAGTSGRSPVPRKSRAPLPSPRRAPRCCY